jgi:predicted component of type VI protein secretion system
MPKLSLISPDGTEVRYSLEGEIFTLGRAEDNDIVINDPRVSSHQAVIKRLESGGFMLSDLGSTNPARINGKPTPIAELKDGDTILLGDIYGHYQGDKAAAAPAASTPAGPPVPPQSGCFALVVAAGLLAAAAAALAAAS